MRSSELQKKILTAIRNKLSQRELCTLCSFIDLSSSGSKRNIQDRLEEHVQNQANSQLVIINNKIDEYISNSKRLPSSDMKISNENSKHDYDTSIYHADTLSDVMLASAPINLKEEVVMIDRNAIVVVHFTNYSSPQTMVPMQAATGVNERVHNIRMPNMLPHVAVHTSPFYCCSICLHPLAMLVPPTMPNIIQNNKIMSTVSFQFSLSDDALKLITRNCQNLGTKKVDYKWQVQLKFAAVEPNLPLPTPGQTVLQMIPPYLSITANNKSTPLWEILPSNCRTKEGKRHAKPVNITDKLNSSNRTKNSYPQAVAVTWWQTPEVFQYYYMGVYLERKLSVKEILDLFTSNRHVNIRPIEDTLRLIKSKLNDPKYRNNDDDDDLVVSSVLPISLSCPVGRSRIEIPIRALACQHLQCFDAQLFLSMNERRSMWKCPVCDSSATPNELFCDKYFLKILLEFKDNEDVNDINVNADGSYVAIHSRKDDKVIPDSNNDKQVAAVVDTMIVLDSDDEEELPKKSSSKEKEHSSHRSSHSTKTTKDRSHSSKERTSRSNSSTESSSDRHKQSHKESHSKHSREQSSSSRHKSSTVPKTVNIQISYPSTTIDEAPVEISHISQYTQPSLSKAINTAIARSSVVPLLNAIPITQTQTPPPVHLLPTPNASLMQVNTAPLPPPLYTPTTNGPRNSIIPSPNLIHLTGQSQFSTFASLQSVHHNIIPAPSAVHVPVPSLISSLIQTPLLTPMPASFLMPTEEASQSSTTNPYRAMNYNSVPVFNKPSVLVSKPTIHIPIGSTVTSTRSSIVSHISTVSLNQTPMNSQANTLIVAPNKPVLVSSFSVPRVSPNQNPPISRAKDPITAPSEPIIKPSIQVNSPTVSSLHSPVNVPPVYSYPIPPSLRPKALFPASSESSNVSSIHASTVASTTIPIVSVIRNSIAEPIKSSLPSSNKDLSETLNRSPIQPSTDFSFKTPIVTSTDVPIVSSNKASLVESIVASVNAPIQSPYRNVQKITVPNQVPAAKVSEAQTPITAQIQTQISNLIRDSVPETPRQSNESPISKTKATISPSSIVVSVAPIVTSPSSEPISAIVNKVSKQSNIAPVVTPVVTVPLIRSNLEIVRTLDDVVRTLATDNVPHPEASITNKNLITMPICCPVIIVDRYSPLTPRKEAIDKTVSVPQGNQCVTPQNEIITKAVTVPQENQSLRNNGVIETIAEALGGIADECSRDEGTIATIPQDPEALIERSASPERNIETINISESANPQKVIENLLSSPASITKSEMSNQSKSLTTEPQPVNTDIPIISIDLTSDDDDDDKVESSQVSPTITSQNNAQSTANNISQISPPNTHQNTPQTASNITANAASQKSPQIRKPYTSANRTQPVLKTTTTTTTTGSNIPIKRPLNNSNIKWCSMQDPTFRKNFLNLGGGSNNRVPASNEVTKQIQRQVSTNTTSQHTSSLKADLAKRPLNTNTLNRKPIEDNDNLNCSPVTKRLRLTNFDDDRMSDGELSPSSSSSSSLAVQRKSVKFSGNSL